MPASLDGKRNQKTGTGNGDGNGQLIILKISHCKNFLLAYNLIIKSVWPWPYLPFKHSIGGISWEKLVKSTLVMIKLDRFS
jgi:hypothetical protein